MKSSTYNDLDGAGMYYAKQNKSVGERQTPYDFTHLWNLRNKTDEQMRSGRKRGERQTNHETFLCLFFIFEREREREREREE